MTKTRAKTKSVTSNVVINSEGSPKLKTVGVVEKSIEEKLEEHKRLLLEKNAEVQLLEEQYKKMVSEKNKPVCMLSEFLFQSFCSKESDHIKWASENNNWEGELHRLWFSVGNDVYEFINKHKNALRI